MRWGGDVELSWQPQQFLSRNELDTILGESDSRNYGLLQPRQERFLLVGLTLTGLACLAEILW